MRKALALALLFSALVAAAPVRAQTGPSNFELYGGYDYIRFNINANVAGQPPFQAFNGNGGGGQLVYNLNNWLGVLGDLSGVWATNATKQGAAIPYLFGPRVNVRHSKIIPFAQALLGGVATSSGFNTSDGKAISRRRSAEASI